MPDQGPAVGEVRTVGPETRRWDGHVWQLVPRTFLGTEDFTGRMKAYAKPVLGTMASDIAAPVLHPLDTISGVANTVMHPFHAADNLVTTGANALKGDPNAAGHLLSMAAAPKAADLALTGTNKLAHAVAENPSVRSGIGYTAGAGTAMATGLGHPFIGAAVGRMVSPLLKYPAEEVAGITDRLRGAIHGTGEAAGSVPPALQKDYAALVTAVGKEGADRWLKRQTEGPRPIAPSANLGQSPSAPKLKVDASTLPDSPADHLTGETPEAWKARVQAKLDKGRGPLPEPPAGTEPIADRMAGGPDKPSKGNGTFTGSNADTAASLNADLARLRRTYGAQRVGEAVNPKAPEVGNGQVTRADIAAGNPGVSSMPEVAWQPLKRDLIAGKSADPARTLRAVQQLLKEHVRNGEKSTVPQRLAELLKDVTPEGQ